MSAEKSLHAIAMEQLKPGDRVVIVGKCLSRDNGWYNVWMGQMDKYVGTTATVKSVHGISGVAINEAPDYLFPAHMLMKEPKGHVALEPGSIYPKTTKKETTIMSASAIITIERRVFVNGADLSNINDDIAFQHIATAEKEIERLKALKAQPKALAARIAKLQEGIDALVEALDERSTK